MKEKIYLVGFLIMTVLNLSSFIYASEKTSTGFYWPLGTSNYNIGGSHLEHDPAHGGDYIGGRHRHVC